MRYYWRIFAVKVSVCPLSACLREFVELYLRRRCDYSVIWLPPKERHLALLEYYGIASLEDSGKVLEIERL